LLLVCAAAVVSLAFAGCAAAKGSLVPVLRERDHSR
jgi:hypothetical protein